MADEVVEGIENAVNLVVFRTEKSGSMKKDLKQIIFRKLYSGALAKKVPKTNLN
jgi:hypothetical protein